MKRPAAGFLLVMGAFLLAGCDSENAPKNYQYFKDHPEEARSVIGDCRINGSRGMDKTGSAECDAANAAEWSTKYESAKEQQRQEQQRMHDVQRQ